MDGRRNKNPAVSAYLHHDAPMNSSRERVNAAPALVVVVG